MFNEVAIVESTEKIASNTFQTFLYSPEIASCTKAGQFVNILPSRNWDKMMRRPMSIASQKDSLISIIYKVVGDGTKLMKNWNIGEKVDLIGPLGNYWDGYSDKLSILIGGGVGIAPIINFNNHLEQVGEKRALIMGAQNHEEHFITHDPENNIYMTTDDGSLGIKGNVIEPLKIILGKNHYKDVKIFACGPPAMMEAVRKFSIRQSIKCDLALETVMACGFGICQGCTVEFDAKEETIHHSYRNRFGLICMDGPIFGSEDIKSCHL